MSEYVGVHVYVCVSACWGMWMYMYVCDACWDMWTIQVCVLCVRAGECTHVCLVFYVYVGSHLHSCLNHKAFRLDPVLEDTKQEISMYCVPSYVV